MTEITRYYIKYVHISIIKYCIYYHTVWYEAGTRLKGLGTKSNSQQEKERTKKGENNGLLENGFTSNKKDGTLTSASTFKITNCQKCTKELPNFTMAKIFFFLSKIASSIALYHFSINQIS